jgi:catechol 2,3-dioxygenase-like lactoylglutathione lyase family enzyme
MTVVRTPADAAVDVQGFDHLVLRVADTRRSAAWYGGLLGLEVLRLDEWERGEVVFASVRITPSTIIDLLEVASDPRVGSLDHLCLVVDPATDLAALAADERFDLIEGPVSRWGAQGDGTSVYVRDPDGITVELRTY